MTAVELMPDHGIRPASTARSATRFTGERLTNAWGYNTTATSSRPSRMYSYYGKVGEQVDEFKMMVRELHKNEHRGHPRRRLQPHPGRESLRPVGLASRGLDNATYYYLMLAPTRPEFYMDFTGCGNTMNCNHPVVRKFILDCLRYWVVEMHVDGFRFDLAAVFAIDVDQQGEGARRRSSTRSRPTRSSPRIKLIAEPWSHHASTVSARSPTAMGRVERQVSRHGPQVDQGRPRRRLRPGHPRDRLLRPLRRRQQRGRPAVPLPQHQLRRPATTASRSTTSSRSTRSTTSATASKAATAPTTTRAGTAATRGSSTRCNAPDLTDEQRSRDRGLAATARSRIS